MFSTVRDIVQRLVKPNIGGLAIIDIDNSYIYIYAYTQRTSELNSKIIDGRKKNRYEINVRWNSFGESFIKKKEEKKKKQKQKIRNK